MSLMNVYHSFDEDSFEIIKDFGRIWADFWLSSFEIAIFS
jgi:hypothetical protein